MPRYTTIAPSEPGWEQPLIADALAGGEKLIQHIDDMILRVACGDDTEYTQAWLEGATAVAADKRVDGETRNRAEKLVKAAHKLGIVKYVEPTPDPNDPIPNIDPTDYKTNRLVNRAIVQRWPLDDTKRRAVVEKVFRAIEGVPEAEPDKVARLADTFIKMEAQNLTDDHQTDKNERLDTGKATENFDISADSLLIQARKIAKVDRQQGE